MTLILGLNAFHADASACLVRDGRVIAAVAEERLGPRRKHFAGFPSLAIQSVLGMAGAKLSDLDFVAVGHDPRANAREKTLYALRHPMTALRAGKTFLSRAGHMGSLRGSIVQAADACEDDAKFELIDVEHHLAHVASSFFCSGFEDAAGFSYDASGDFVSTMFARCETNSIDPIGKVFLPNSLGYFYTSLCQFIGFSQFGEEYKVMGLAAYGKPRFAMLMENMISPAENGQFTMNPDYFGALNTEAHADLVNDSGEIIIPRLFSKRLESELGPPRMRGAEITQRDKDIAASCQLHFENIVLHSLRWLHSQMPVSRLVTAGGCALNGVCNARILRETPFKESYIQCAAGDDGTAIGAALQVWRSKCGSQGRTVMTHAYLGPTYSPQDIAKAVATAGLENVVMEREDLLRYVASRLAEGMIVGWYQGRSEWGPRALGNRSILAHPGWPGMKNMINEKIKRRESFRPFAPSVLEEYVPEYFVQDVKSPFMMHVVEIRAEKRGELAAVTHEDGTGRLQTVSRASNHLYYDLIDAFRQLTGIPVLLNTSFNENEPIVDTPEQAIDCFSRNDIDILCLGDHVITKRRPTDRLSPQMQSPR